MKSLFLVSLLAAAALCGSGCENTGAKSDHKSTAAVTPSEGDILAPGEELRIVFAGAPELSQTQKIRPDGNISLPKVGEVKAAGKRPAALQAQLVALYKPSLVNSEITVVVTSSSFPVIVLGAVNRPGEVTLDRPSLLQAIGKAGGIVRGLGDASKVRIIHEGDNSSTGRTVNLQAVLTGRSDAIIYLQRGDTVIVPEKWL